MRESRHHRQGRQNIFSFEPKHEDHFCETYLVDSDEGRGRCLEFGGGRYGGRMCGYSDGVGRAGMGDAEGMAVEGW